MERIWNMIWKKWVAENSRELSCVHSHSFYPRCAPSFSSKELNERFSISLSIYVPYLLHLRSSIWIRTDFVASELVGCKGLHANLATAPYV